VVSAAVHDMFSLCYLVQVSYMIVALLNCAMRSAVDCIIASLPLKTALFPAVVHCFAG
jgi:hypothetical protein